MLPHAPEDAALRLAVCACLKKLAAVTGTFYMTLNKPAFIGPGLS